MISGAIAMKKKVLGLGMGALLLGAAAMAGGHLQYEVRQAAMKQVGAGMQVMGQMAQGQVAFDADALAAAVAAMQTAAQAAQAAFPAESDAGAGNRARAEIWDNRADFDGKFAALGAALDAVAANPPADVAGIAPAMASLGGTCQACHQAYRLPES
jgi:cytochrome c556